MREILSAVAYNPPPLSELCENIERMCSMEGETEKSVAKKLSISDSMLFCYRRIHKLPSKMEEIFEGLPEKERRLAITDIHEFRRRISFQYGDCDRIPFAFARELATVVFSKRKFAMNSRGIAAVLRSITNGDIPEWDLFRQRIFDWRKRFGITGT